MLKYVFICKNMNFRGLLINNKNQFRRNWNEHWSGHSMSFTSLVLSVIDQLILHYSENNTDNNDFSKE